MHRDREYLQDIIRAARLAMDYVAGVSMQDFLSNFQRQDAVVRRLEMIGEAARRVSKDSRDAMPELPWNRMISMRNMLIHEYDDVDYRIVWETVVNDLPPLVSALEKRLETDAASD